MQNSYKQKEIEKNVLVALPPLKTRLPDFGGPTFKDFTPLADADVLNDTASDS